MGACIRICITEQKTCPCLSTPKYHTVPYVLWYFVCFLNHWFVDRNYNILKSKHHSLVRFLRPVFPNLFFLPFYFDTTYILYCVCLNKIKIEANITILPHFLFWYRRDINTFLINCMMPEKESNQWKIAASFLMWWDWPEVQVSQIDEKQLHKFKCGP